MSAGVSTKLDCHFDVGDSARARARAGRCFARSGASTAADLISGISISEDR
jgi:hypothetical protein